MFCSIFHSNICVIWASSYFNWKCLHITGKSLSTLLCHGSHMTNGGEWRCSVLIISKCVIFGCSDSSCWPLDYCLRTKELFGPMHTNFESFTRYSLTPLPTYRKKYFFEYFLDYRESDNHFTQSCIFENTFLQENQFSSEFKWISIFSKTLI